MSPSALRKQAAAISHAAARILREAERQLCAADAVIASSRRALRAFRIGEASRRRALGR